MSKALADKPKPWLLGRKRPEAGQKIREWWTPERREAKRQEMLLLNPNAVYHGLSCKGARRLKGTLGRCDNCGGDGSESRLDVHHLNGNKRDQSLANLTILCHRCHMQTHSAQGDLVRQRQRR
jgi:5-methylcytosine-specific restriction endonuclease McrA